MLGNYRYSTLIQAKTTFFFALSNLVSVKHITKCNVFRATDDLLKHMLVNQEKCVCVCVCVCEYVEYFVHKSIQKAGSYILLILGSFKYDVIQCDTFCCQECVQGGYVNTLRMGLLNCLNARSRGLNFRHRASCIQGQAFRYSPENAFYIFNQQIYFII